MDWCFNWINGFAKSFSIELLVNKLGGFITNPKNDTQRLEVINWVHFVPTYLQNSKYFHWGLEQLELALAHSTYLVGFSVTYADVALWLFLETSEECQKILTSDPCTHLGCSLAHVIRYYNHLTSLSHFSSWKKHLQNWKAIQTENQVSVVPVDEAFGKTTASEMKFEIGGKFGDLPGAKVGEVVVRFPPEASGYLHIGHAKAALLNQHYRDIFKGRLVLRFDDTNPSKEKDVFEQSILYDLPRLGVRWDVRSHTSDHFDLLMSLCEQLIREGKAYVDDTDVAVMKVQRENRTPSVCRDNAVEKNLSWWEEMKKGTDFGTKCCVRAKINMSSNNGALRDPAIYRCRREPHVRTGNKYNVYPLYDFACPIVDSIEGITHALRTSEYNDRNEQYAWICQALGIRCPRVIDYSRLALQNTLLSKRKLTWFVEEGLVDGWDDPRMPTVSGILRRGMTAEGLRQFILAQGSSRSCAQMEWDKIWAFNKKVIDPLAPRYTALLMDPNVPPVTGKPHGLVPIHVIGQDELTEKQVPFHPKNEQLGQRTILLGPLVYVEYTDAALFRETENVTFINWGNCCVQKIHYQHDLIVRIDVQLNLENTDFKKTLKVTWLADPGENGPHLTPVTCLIYDHLLCKAILTKDDDFKLYVNRSSKVDQCLLGDSGLQKLQKGDIVQLQRRGFYICDVPYSSNCLATGCESPCVLIQIPEGTAKSDSAVGEAASKAVKSSGSSKMKTKPVPVTADDESKVAERLKKKAEKKEARKEGRTRWKQENQPMPADGQPIAHSGEPVQNIPQRGTTGTESASRLPSQDKHVVKKQTRLALEARKEVDFADWYTQVITKAEMLEYYDVSGCYILRPWAYSIWQTIQRYMDSRLQPLGVENAYFPIFVSKSALEKEKTHLEDFAPEVAWVMKSGDSDLAEPVAIRPTSETIIYPAFGKWIQSHRDLPLRINQWCNVVRWEFKHPQPFLRTREFLWQEGHTAYAEKSDAEAEVLVMLELYADVYEQLLAVPVVRGRKTEKEKFAGSDYTTTVEAYISGTGRAIQGATSHHLGQNFSRMFDVTYDHPITGMPAFVYQNSWGFTTRSLGVLIMVHGDNKGLVLPPRVAPIQIAIIPCGITNKTSADDRDKLITTCQQVASMLRKDKALYRVQCDDRTHVSPGWKFNHWERKGVPVRLEIGPQEMAERSACLVLRHNSKRMHVPMDGLIDQLPSILDSVHTDLLEKARAEYANHIVEVNGISELCAALDVKSLGLAPFCGEPECEESVRTESSRNVNVEPGAPSMGAKSLCIPFSCELNSKLKCGTPVAGTKCFNQPHCSRPALFYTLFGRSY